MKKMLLIALLANFPCIADMICIENMTGDDVSITLQKGAYTLYECIPMQLGTENVELRNENFCLRNKAQFLFETKYVFTSSSDKCGFYVNRENIIDITDYESQQFDRGNFSIEVLYKDPVSPLPYKAFYADRTYRITKSMSASPSPRKEVEASQTKRSVSAPSFKGKSDD